MVNKQPKCFVPECNNSVGVLFPKTLDVRKKWLKALNLEHLQPDPKSFVCLDHFEENGQPGIRHNTGAELKNKGGSSSLQGDMHVQRKSTQSYKQGHKNSSDLELSTDNIENEDDYTIYCKYEKMCRLCMIRASNVTTSVFDKLNKKYTVAQAIGICLFPLQVLPNDNLSSSICTKCIKCLTDFLNFRQTCLEMDAKQRELISLGHYNMYSNDYDSYGESEDSNEYLHEERLSDYENDKENQEDFRTDNTNGQILKFPLINSDNSSKLNNLPVKKRYDSGDEELLKVLEGNDDIVGEKSKSAKTFVENNDEFYYGSEHDISIDPSSKDDSEYTENIIIEMVNEETSPVTSLVNTAKLPITIKRVESTSPQKKGVKRKFSSSNNFSSRKSMTMLKGENKEEIVILPSGISVARKEVYHSPLGVFRSEVLKYAFNSKYLLAGGYLYDFGLVKDNLRRLSCIVNKCPGMARQTRLSYNNFSEDVEVIASHNHEVPDTLERKRQMFYHILYGKMRKDKNFNFKTLYEKFCKLDSSLIDILPLRSVIKEICKQGPAPSPPLLRSFDQFYEYVENDNFHKIHFTSNHVQFYQDRFESEDGGKAVVFGNQEIIEEYSSSQLMYVDASFVIDSYDFPYQLVTVLVWVDQSYYPILYALVNIKSQEIYKKIFSFLYNNLAPNLRPHEIITDYEANLYYALGETYVESSIGGSMFYFTQNIYKKICALNLARELELNSNFRSIYNMLLMLPLLPVNTILDGLKNIEVQAKELELEHLTDQLFIHVHNEWIFKVTPELFCVHRLENRINENIVAPFKKLRDLIMLSRSKSAKRHMSSVVITIEKLIELENFLRETYDTTSGKSFAKDLSSSQKKIILKAWNYIENHPMININQFFLKVLGYIKCMENQLWIWGFYRYEGDSQDTLIDANNFSIINDDNQESEYQEQLEVEPMDEDVAQQGEEDIPTEIIEEYYIEEGGSIRKVEFKKYIDDVTDEGQVKGEQTMEQQHSTKETTVVMEAVIDENGRFVLQESSKQAFSDSETKTTDYVHK